MLYLIGLGLCDGDIPVRGVEALEQVDAAYAELYTNTIAYNLDRLEEETGTAVAVLDREQVEDEDRVVAEAADRDVAFLVSGDPLAATTHQDLLFRAREAGIETAVVHAPSVFTAVAETGLSLYKFGRTTTLTVQEGEIPQSVFDAIQTNRETGLHTLVLVDPAMEVPGPMQFLADAGIEGEVLLCSRLGTPQRSIVRGEPTALELAAEERPAAVVVPGELSGNEEERLQHV